MPTEIVYNFHISVLKENSNENLHWSQDHTENLKFSINFIIAISQYFTTVFLRKISIGRPKEIYIQTARLYA